jgi:hypothetical protein
MKMRNRVKESHLQVMLIDRQLRPDNPGSVAIQTFSQYPPTGPYQDVFHAWYKNLSMLTID